MSDRKRFRSFVLWTITFFVLLVPLSAGAPMASGGGCDWGCADGFALNLRAGGCPSSGSDCMRCWIVCEI